LAPAFHQLEVAALQSLVDPEDMLELDGLSDEAWRRRIGNAVPPHTADAIAGVMAKAFCWPSKAKPSFSAIYPYGAGQWLLACVG
jgi:hypothetical protein